MLTQSDAPRFPTWFVPDCPPDDAGDATGTIYRFVAKAPGEPPEFRSYHETNERPNAPPCQRCGLSVFRTPEDVRTLLRHLWRLFPRKSYGPDIVKRDLSPDDGRMKPTGNHGHETWWAYEGVARHTSFEFVETVGRIEG